MNIVHYLSTHKTTQILVHIGTLGCTLEVYNIIHCWKLWLLELCPCYIFSYSRLVPCYFSYIPSFLFPYYFSCVLSCLVLGHFSCIVSCLVPATFCLCYCLAPGNLFNIFSFWIPCYFYWILSCPVPRYFIFLLFSCTFSSVFFDTFVYSFLFL